MKSIRFIFYLLFPLFSFAEHNTQPSVGLLIVATGKYIQWVQPLISSADRFFLPDCQVTYFIFTDAQDYLSQERRFDSVREVKVLAHQRLGWPYDTMMRPKVYYSYAADLATIDYVFALDADMLFVDTVGNEILGDLVATQHPGFVGRRGSYETRRVSTACVDPHEGVCYFAGGFNGGTTCEYLALCKKITDNIELDLAHDVIAVWHDESHINRYFIDNPPSVILSPSYCYPESWNIPYHKRLLALDKNHAEVRK